MRNATQSIGVATKMLRRLTDALDHDKCALVNGRDTDSRSIGKIANMLSEEEANRG